MRQYFSKINGAIAVGLLGICAIVISLIVGVFAPSAGSGVIQLGVRPALAAEEEIQRLSDIGVAAYLDSNQSIDLSELIGTFEVIEDQTADYIIGSISLPNYEDQQDEIFHAHAYVSADGWIMVYFMDDAPASKIVDWRAYVDSGGSSLNTLLEIGMREVANDADVAYEQPAFYDFRFPNATHMMIIGEFTGPNVFDSFRIELPSSATYYETSWGMFRPPVCCSDPFWSINGNRVAGSAISSNTIGFGNVEMQTDEEHTIGMTFTGGLVVVYKE